MTPDAAAPAPVAASVAHMLERDAFSRWLGIVVGRCAPGQCTARLAVRADMVNGFGVAHGGIAFSLADSAMAFACNAEGPVTVAIDNAISYPHAVRVGDRLVAVAEQESTTNRLAYYRVTVSREGGEVVALFRGTVYRTNQQHPTPDGT